MQKGLINCIYFLIMQILIYNFHFWMYIQLNIPCWLGSYTLSPQAGFRVFVRKTFAQFLRKGMQSFASVAYILALKNAFCAIKLKSHVAKNVSFLQLYFGQLGCAIGLHNWVAQLGCTIGLRNWDAQFPFFAKFILLIIHFLGNKSQPTRQFLIFFGGSLLCVFLFLIFIDFIFTSFYLNIILITFFFLFINGFN